MAAYALRRHSCTTVRERAARAQRRLDRLALSGPEQPCQHNDRHPHGNRVRYVIDKCRCRPCRDSTRAYEQARNRARAYGKVSYVNADPARNHIRSLQAQGMGWKRVARAAGLDSSVVWKLLYGDPSRPQAPSRRIRPATQAAILTVTLNLADGAKVDSTGTTRRIQALVAIGWSQSKIAARLGILPSNFTDLAHGRRGVTMAHAKAVADLYDQLWDQTPPHVEWRAHIAYSRSLSYAAKAGWVVPMAWDDIDTDDTSQVDVATLNGRPKKVHIEDVEWLLAEDLTLDGIAARLGAKPNTVEQACYRAGRTDLLAQFTRQRDLANRRDLTTPRKAIA